MMIKTFRTTYNINIDRISSESGKLRSLLVIFLCIPSVEVYVITLVLYGLDSIELAKVIFYPLLPILRRLYLHAVLNLHLLDI